MRFPCCRREDGDNAPGDPTKLASSNAVGRLWAGLAAQVLPSAVSKGARRRTVPHVGFAAAQGDTAAGQARPQASGVRTPLAPDALLLGGRITGIILQKNILQINAAVISFLLLAQ